MHVGYMVLAGVLGAIVGSFLNVVIHRVPRGGSLVRPSSACPGCGTPIDPSDNVPMVSFILLRGRCRTCRTKISPRYPVVEGATALLFAGAAWRFGAAEEAVFIAACSSVLVVLAAIDLEHRRVPNVIVLPAVVAVMMWVLVVAATGGGWGIVMESVASGASAFLLFLVIALVSGGMGFGDVKLAAFVGVACGRFGWETTVLAVFAAFVVGGLVATILLVAGRSSRKDALPFAPALGVAAIGALFAGPGPVRAWLGF